MVTWGVVFYKTEFKLENNHHEMPAPETVPKKKKRRSVKPLTFRLPSVLLIALIVGLGSFAFGTRANEFDLQLFGRKNDSPASLDLTSVQDVYRTLRDNYDGELDTKKLVDGAKHGLVDAAGDPYTTYFNEKEAKEFFDDLEGQFSGIGAELGRKDDKLYVVSVIDGSPAEKSGLKANDAIVNVNDEESSDWSVEKAVSQIRGEKGTSVKLTVLRGQEFKEISIVRDVITNPSVKSEVTADNIGVMRISRFSESETTLAARRAAEDFKSKGVKAVILDLRNNGGGYAAASVDVAGLWLENKVVYTERRGGSVVDTERTGSDAPLKGIKTIVLVNGASASASEILAGALKDNNAATLLGEQTYGKGSVQQILGVPNNGQLKVTIARWFTPAGMNISKQGIAPDVTVEQPSGEVDAQYERALEMLK